MNVRPRFSVCIPAYNRPGELARLLESIAAQYSELWEIVISEDHSSSRAEIALAVQDFVNDYPAIRVRYFENESNFGYDKNLRQLLDRSEGEYCMFMGDDDILAPKALDHLARAIEDNSVGFVLRAWKSVNAFSGEEIEFHRYFAGDRIFPPGPESVAALFRRAVFFSGLMFHRESARQCHTARFDGTLLYQLYLVGQIVNTLPAYYISDVIAIRMVGGNHFFGSSAVELGTFTPQILLPEHSVRFLSGLLKIARAIDNEVCPRVYKPILADLAAYSYPLLEIQARQLGRPDFLAYGNQIGALGLRSSIYFWTYFLALLLIGPRFVGRVMRMIKRILGATPVIRGSSGQSV